MKLPPWTSTLLSDDENCPRKAWHKYVAKDLPREEPSPELLWGRKVHEAFEKRLVVKTPLPEDMVRFETFALAIDTTPGKKLVEQSLAITASGAPADFFGENVWGRGRLDVCVMHEAVAVIFDWKTGNSKYEDTLEIELHALMLKCKYPGLQKIAGNYVWLKDMRLGKTHDLSNFARTWNDVKLRMRDIEARPLEKEWVAKPNPLCGFCPVKTCEHNRSK